LLPLFAPHEEDIAVNDVLHSSREDIHEVVMVFDADALQKVDVSDENGRPGSLVNDSEPVKVTMTMIKMPGFLCNQPCNGGAPSPTICTKEKIFPKLHYA